MFKSAIFTKTLGVIGELLITLGVIVLLFLAWQVWINNAILVREQQIATSELEQEWSVGRDPEQRPAEEEKDFGPAPAFTGVAQNVTFATIFIPRLGDESTRAIINSTDLPTALDKGYYGRYEQTQWPGQPGNFALAVHRTGNGSPFANSTEFRAGDKIYVQTETGYYTYVFRNYEYVLPTAVDVLQPIPGTNAAINPQQSIITITTCNPLLGDAERLIIYGVLESWRPLDAGPPLEMRATQKEGA